MNHLHSKYIDQVIQYALDHGHQSEIHGYDHWCRVARNASLLMDEGVNHKVVELFAFFHDIRRLSDGPDPDHGARGADCAIELRERLLSDLTDHEFDQLITACRLHTSTPRTDDPTINACFDADRLDLWRVSMTPDPAQMASPRGRMLAERFDELRFVFMSTPRMRDTVAIDIRRIMVERSLTLSTAESFTSGRIAAELTRVSGSSEYFQGSIVAYQDALKVQHLGVDPQIIRDCGVVSRPVVEQMVRGACRLFHTDLAIASTGYAEAVDGLATRWLAWGSEEEVECLCLTEDLGREVNTQQATIEALRHFLDYLTRIPK